MLKVASTSAGSASSVSAAGSRKIPAAASALLLTPRQVTTTKYGAMLIVLDV